MIEAAAARCGETANEIGAGRIGQRLQHLVESLVTRVDMDDRFGEAEVRRAERRRHGARCVLEEFDMPLRPSSDHRSDGRLIENAFLASHDAEAQSADPIGDTCALTQKIDDRAKIPFEPIRRIDEAHAAALAFCGKIADDCIDRGSGIFVKRKRDAKRIYLAHYLSSHGPYDRIRRDFEQSSATKEM